LQHTITFAQTLILSASLAQHMLIYIPSTEPQLGLYHTIEQYKCNTKALGGQLGLGSVWVVYESCLSGRGRGILSTRWLTGSFLFVLGYDARQASLTYIQERSRRVASIRSARFGVTEPFHLCFFWPFNLD